MSEVTDGTEPIVNPEPAATTPPDGVSDVQAEAPLPAGEAPGVPEDATTPTPAAEAVEEHSPAAAADETVTEPSPLGESYSGVPRK